MNRSINSMPVAGIPAEEEYKKNKNLKREDIAFLKEWVKTQENLPPITEEKLIQFHHSCYYKMEETKSCILVYHRLRLSTPEFFYERDITTPQLKNSCQVLQMGCLPVKDPNGYQIVYIGLQDYDYSKFSFPNAIKMLVMGVEACLTSEGTLPGYVILINIKGAKLGHLMKFHPRLLKRLFDYVQDGIPIRLQAIHVVNSFSIVEKFLYLAKPFIKKELLELMHFHYGGYDEVQRYLPKYCLPCDFGGELPSCEELHKRYMEWLTKLAPTFLEEDKILFENAKPTTPTSTWGNWIPFT